MFLFKGLLVDKLKSSLKDYLFVFDNNNIDTSFLLGQTTLTNVLVKPDKINEIFREQNLPITLKAGMISKLGLKVSIEHSDLHIDQHTATDVRRSPRHY